MTDSNGATGSGAQGAVREQMGPNDSDGTGDQGRAMEMSVRGGDRLPEDCGGPGVTEDPGRDGVLRAC